MARLEHLNVTVANPEATAAMLDAVFGWKIRWQGGSIHDGRSIHVGEEATYLALYAPPDGAKQVDRDSYRERAGLNHLGIVVDDLDAVETKVVAQGYVPNSHADYEPGRRFYFDDENGIEFEVICYDE